MAAKYEIKDRQDPRARGMRFSSLERAQRELAHAPRSRYMLVDRDTGQEVEPA